MRNWLLMMLFTFSSAVLQAGEKELDSNLFACVDKQTLSIDGDCIETMVSYTLAETESMIDYTVLSGDLGDNALATMRFYPDKMLIEIVAQLEESDAALSAKVSE